MFRSALTRALRRSTASLSTTTGTNMTPPRRLLSTPAAATTTSTTIPVGGSLVTSMAAQNPHINVVRYEHKNRTWTTGQVEYWSEALAVGFLETGLQPGDVVLSWLPAHFSEQMILQFACSKAGLILYELDPSLAITDPESSKVALGKALTLTKANVLVSQEAGDDVNYINLAESLIPELQIYDMDDGMPFVSPRFPHLRFCMQTGFDDEDTEGWYRYAYFLVPGDESKNLVTNPVSPDMPLKGQFQLNPQGIPTGIDTPLTNQQVIDQKVWPTYSKILEKEFHNVEGVGVIF